MKETRRGLAAVSHRINNLAPWQGFGLVVVFSAVLVAVASMIGK